MKYSERRPVMELFIVDNDASVTTSLKNYLQIRFGKLLNISVFSTGFEAVLAMDEKTDVIVLENYLVGEKGSSLRNSIRLKNHFVQVIRLGPNRETGDAIELYSNGVLRKTRSYLPSRKLIQPVLRALTYPARKLAKEFDVNQFLAIILISILFIGIVTGVVLIALR